jgi:hypothetical protein
MMLVSLSLLACSHGAERGRPETLHPILGRAGLGAGVPRTRPSEPVEDYALDLSALVPAWPTVSSELPHLVRAVIARGSWTDEHHRATALDGVLRVRHRPEVVVEVRRLVQSLRDKLLQPLQIQVAFVELDLARKDRVLRLDAARWDSRAFREAVAAGKARTLARALLSGHNGQWLLADRVSNQVFLSGVTVAEGAISPRNITLASGFTVQAAAWRWGADRAVIALTGLYTGEAVGEADARAHKVTQKVHRLLPSQKTYEKNWQLHDVELQLPVREMVEFQSQLTVTRGRWSAVALLPRSKRRLCAVVARVDWRTPIPEIQGAKTFSPEGYRLDVIPIALPTSAARPASRFDKNLAIDNRRDIEASSVTWFKKRAEVYHTAQKKETFNFQAASGNLELSLAPQSSYFKGKSSELQSRGGRSGGGDAGALPAELEKLRLDVMQADWPEGTALEFVANHVFVVHRSDLNAKLRTLLEKTHTWRNDRVLVSVAFPLLEARTADELEGNRPGRTLARKLRRGETLLPEALVVGRGGSRAEIFVGEMHAVLSEAWAPDRSSPPVHVYWRGARLAVTPHLSGARRSFHLDLEWKQHRLGRIAPRTVAGAILQQPTDSTWTHQQPLQLASDTSVLVGLQSDEGKLPALLVTAR